MSAKYFKMGHPTMSTKNVKTGHVRKTLLVMEEKKRKKSNLFLTIFLLQTTKVHVNPVQ